MISPQALKRAHDIIETAKKEGATILLDGRGVKVPGFEKGNFLGPTIITGVKPNMTCYTEENFWTSSHLFGSSNFGRCHYIDKQQSIWKWMRNFHKQWIRL